MNMTETCDDIYKSTAAPKLEPLRVLTKINTHKTNPANDLVEIITLDEPGPGGAHHEYMVYWPMNNGMRGTGLSSVKVQFQKGPILENGVNGLTQEVLLAIVAHRLECFQKGLFANTYNQQALDNVNAALAQLHNRTLDRQSRGVEGTNTL